MAKKYEAVANYGSSKKSLGTFDSAQAARDAVQQARGRRRLGSSTSYSVKEK